MPLKTHIAVKKTPVVTGKPEPKRPLSTTNDPQRRLAEMMRLREGFGIGIRKLGATPITKLGKLPQGRLFVHHISVIRGDPLSAEERIALGEIKSLDIVGFGNVQFSDADCKALKHGGSIFSLGLNDNNLTNEAVAHLSELTDLRNLRLDGNPGITDAACDPLVKLTALRKLDIASTRITGAGLKRLTALPNLNRLILDLSHGITAADLAELRSLESLRTLFLSGNASDDVVEHLVGVRQNNPWSVIPCFSANLSAAG